MWTGGENVIAIDDLAILHEIVEDKELQAKRGG